MCARSAAATARSTPDVRNVFSADFSPDYLGNCFLLNTAPIPLAELIAPSTPLGRITQALRQSAAGVDSGAVHDAYALLPSTPDLSRVQARFVKWPESANLLLSNVIALPMSEIQFEGAVFWERRDAACAAGAAWVVRNRM